MSRRGRARLSAARELLDRGQLAEAKALAEECLRERPEDFDALHLLGVVAARQGDLVAGATWLERAVAANPGAAQAWHNLGLTREKAGLGDAAIAAYRSAVEADRTFAPAHIGLANQLIARRRFPEAAEGLKAVLSLRPDDLRSASTHACLRRIMCDWEEIDRLEGELVAAVAAGRAGVLPFPFLAMTDDPALQLACARRSAAAKSVPVEAPRRPAGGRIRLGYLSADFRDHATSFLMAELFELHDRARFEVVGFSYGPRERSPMRRRLEGAFDRFVDIADASDEAAALRIRAAEIDIAIDLKGLTQDGRLGILSAHPAPVQVHYIGYQIGRAHV